MTTLLPHPADLVDLEQQLEQLDEPADDEPADQPAPPAPGLVAPPAPAASVTAAFAWLATLATLATAGDPESVEVEVPAASIAVTLPNLTAYREWCALLGCPLADLVDDDLGTYARTVAQAGGWAVRLGHHITWSAA